jgi:ABC-2 type transport system permease protein
MALLLQMALVLGSLGSGIVTIWIFGREYSEGVIKDILALPVSRFNIVLAKSIIALIWSLFLLLILFVTGILTGLLIKLDDLSEGLLLQSTSTFWLTSILTVLLFTPVSLITSMSRGYLLPVGFIILMMIVTQLVGVGLPFLMPYFSWAVPAVISGVAGPGVPEADFFSWLILIVTFLLGFAGTTAWWRYADHH